MFEIATRQKFRFPYHGSISVEDLWDLTPANLDTVYKALNSQKKQTEEESLLSAKTAESSVLDLKINIVKHIVVTKLAEAEARKNAAEKKKQREKIAEIIAAKQDEALQGKSIEELTAMLNSME